MDSTSSVPDRATLALSPIEKRWNENAVNRPKLGRSDRVIFPEGYFVNFPGARTDAQGWINLPCSGAYCLKLIKVRIIELQRFDEELDTHPEDEGADVTPSYAKCKQCVDIDMVNRRHRTHVPQPKKKSLFETLFGIAA